MNTELRKPAPPAEGPKPVASKPKEVLEAYTFRRQGWPRVRQATLLFGTVLLVSAALVGAMQLMLARTRPDTAAALQQQVAASERYNQAETEKLQIEQYQGAFELLRVRGFAAVENRLVMLEAIGAIQRAYRLLPIAYEFAPQQLVALDPEQLNAPLELHSTTVTMKMNLLHEMDLVNFLQNLKSYGVFATKQCDVTPSTGVEGAAGQGRLNAQCTLFWLTVGEAAAPPAPAPGT